MKLPSLNSELSLGSAKRVPLSSGLALGVVEGNSTVPTLGGLALARKRRTE